MTPERKKKIEKMQRRRQSGLTLLMENIHKPYNLSAIARTCDAVGIGQIHATGMIGQKASLITSVSRGSNRWTDLVLYENISRAYNRLRNDNFQIVAAHLSPNAVHFRTIDYTRKTAIVLGQELDGLSTWAAKNADYCVEIPMYGMVESLNVSVAAAVIMYEAQRQREIAGMYDGTMETR